VSPVIDTSKADIVDTSHVDAALASARRNEETARKRATILAWGKAVLLGGVGMAAIFFAASFLVQPRVIETTKVIEKQVVVEREAKPKTAKVPKIAPPPPPPPPQPAPTTETHPWDQLADKQYVGIITDVIDGTVCYNHQTTDCTHALKVGADGHVVVDSKGNSVRDPDVDFSPMVKWIGYSTYRAHRPGEPLDASDSWVADHGELIHFESARKGKTDVVMLKSDGLGLLLDVGLGAPPNGTVHPFVLDTGATDLTVTSDVASQLISAGHAEPGNPETVTYADGKPHHVPTVTIDTVRVGIHVVRDVHASVTPTGAPMLLGLNVLNAIGRFEVDAPHRTLTFNGGAS
jgi:clan AA aspartic protease (TIGR02281 family)